MSDKRALLTLAHIVEPADSAIALLVAELGAVSAVDLIAAGRVPARHAQGLRARLTALDLDREMRKAEALGVQVVVRSDPGWPAALDDLGPARPYALWVKGSADLAELSQRSVAIVGTRDPSSYGQHIARTWTSGLVEDDWIIVSGGAYGIDAAAHRAALDCSGRTICVLASGVDVPYPSAHAPMFDRITERGLVISESPLGVGARRQRFLTRNRVIAALTAATIVVEAALRSGTTSTANAAARLARLVFAVPGPVTSMTSAGCHRLINDQVALLASSLADVRETLSPLGTVLTPDVPTNPRDVLTNVQARVLDALPARGPLSFEQLVFDAGLDVADTALALAALQQLGFVAADSAGWRLTPRG